MLDFLKNLFTKNLGLKLFALFLALACWFYIVAEIKKAGDEERKILKKIILSEKEDSTVREKIQW